VWWIAETGNQRKEYTGKIVTKVILAARMIIRAERVWWIAGTGNQRKEYTGKIVTKVILAASMIIRADS